MQLNGKLLWKSKFYMDFTVCRSHAEPGGRGKQGAKVSIRGASIHSRPEVMPVQVPTIGKLRGCPGHKAKEGGGAKITKEGSKIHQKYSKTVSVMPV